MGQIVGAPRKIRTQGLTKVLQKSGEGEESSSAALGRAPSHLETQLTRMKAEESATLSVRHKLGSKQQKT